MATVSVRISDEMKREMEKHPTVNWSEVLRQAICQKLNNQNESNLVKAVLLNERIRKVAPEGWDSTDFIRKDRRRPPKINKS
ncbi:MAG: hypothetical protein ACW99A_16085 [Candidatus Kariarchaeaceae archaeon]|jgi:Arc/MetJ-type ribon-helix-helix transcriptional regulator